MEAYLLEWLNLLVRWTHLIVGIAWIGSSFYFVWLDTNLNKPPRDPESDDVAGDLWAVHGGGFYHAQKYQVAPQELPEPLHWFKWEAYTTWLSGFALFVLMYYVNADVYLVDSSSGISANAAIGISVALLLAGWVVYDLLCRSGLNDRLIGALGFLLIILVSWLVSQYFSGRGAYIQVGAMLGTIMVANVLMIIIPGQRELVEAKKRGEEPDPMPGIRGKQRSVHNNYITLPVLFVMLSPHYPMTYSHDYNWLVLIVIFVAAILIRHFFNLRNSGKVQPMLPIAAVLILAGLVFAIAPKTKSSADARAHVPVDMVVSFADVQAIIVNRCNTCHSSTPNHPTAPVAPNGVMFDTREQIEQWAARIHERTVVTRTMPLANLTGITDEERNMLDAWFRGIAKSP